ncbi:hypothetical protein ACFE04_000649 [Oxalis oulophora]
MDAFRVSNNRSSSDKFSFKEGNKRVCKHRDPPSFASDSSSCSSRSTIEDSVTFELSWRSSKQTLGTPMKKLLAVEMSKENESKKRSPSVVARLMGLDVLPPSQPHVHKQQRGHVENYEQRSTCSNRALRSSTTSSRRSSRNSSKDDQEFKDVFEVLDSSRMESGINPLKRTAKHNSDAEMAFIQQKIMAAKRPSTKENSQASKGFNKELEELDSNKDLLLKYLEQPDLLFTKHLHDLQKAPNPSHFDPITVLKSSNISKFEHSGPGKEQDRESSWKNHDRSPQRQHELQDRQSCYSKRAAKSTNKLSNGNVGNKSVSPTRIVVLKPNIGMNATGIDSSARSSHDFLSDCGKSEILRNREVSSWGEKKKQSDDGHKSRESRQIAKEITRQMRESFSNGSVKLSASKFKEYGMESQAHAVLENDSSDESVLTTSRDNLDWSNRHKPSSSRSTESSVSREAKKRLSERWKITHNRSQETRVATRGSTLGEMLAIPDKDARSENRDKINVQNVSAGWVEPLGISSRDGWMDGQISNLPRSRSLPSSSAAFGNTKTTMRCETFRSDRYVTTRDFNKRERKRVPRWNSDQREILAFRKSRSSRRRSLSSGCSDRESSGRESSDSSPERHFNYSQVKSRRTFKTDGSPERDRNFVMTDTCLVPSNPDVELLTETTCSKPSFSEPENILISGGPENLSSQETLDEKSKEVPFNKPIPDLDSPSSSKEAEQPSPLSILEAPFADDLSSCSDNFESLSADLLGLRMQLQLLKSESDIHAEEDGPMFTYSDEDAGEGSIMFTRDKQMKSGEEYWESSYLTDVLTGSGFQSAADPDGFLSAMHSPECPVNPLLFEELEKKYREMMSVPKSERRLMFDRINLKMLDIYQQIADPHPWIRLETGVCPLWNKNAMEDMRWSLLNEDEKVKINAHEKAFGRESDWLDLGEEIDKIGKEIERLLVHELVLEMMV